MKKKIVKWIAAAGIFTLLSASLAGCNGVNITEISSQTVSEIASEVVVENTSESDWVKPETGGVKEADEQEDVVTEDDYMEFINGNASVYVEYENTEGLTTGKSYTLDEMVDTLNQELPEHWGPEGIVVQEVGYAFIDCGNDGVPEMAIYVETNTEEYHEGMTEYYYIKMKDGKLTLVQNYSTQGRAQGEMNKYGNYHSFGSGGAALFYNGYDHIKADGTREFAYDCETHLGLEGPVLYGNQLPSNANVPDDLPAFAEEFGEYTCDEYSFEEYTEDMYDDEAKYDAYKAAKKYVFYDPDGKVCFPSDENEKIYFDAGITVTDEDNLQEFIAQRLHDLGITEEEMSFEDGTDYEPHWVVERDYVHTEGQGGEN